MNSGFKDPTDKVKQRVTISDSTPERDTATAIQKLL